MTAAKETLRLDFTYMRQAGVFGDWGGISLVFLVQPLLLGEPTLLVVGVLTGFGGRLQDALYFFHVITRDFVLLFFFPKHFYFSFH